MGTTEETAKVVSELATKAPLDRMLVVACLGLIGFSSFWFLPNQMEKYDIRASVREQAFIENNAAQRTEHLHFQKTQQDGYAATLADQREMVSKSLDRLFADTDRLTKAIEKLVAAMDKTP